MLASGYILPPLGIFLMWRYGPWPVWLKSGVTVLGLSLALLSSFITSAYVLPHVF